MTKNFTITFFLKHFINISFSSISVIFNALHIRYSKLYVISIQYVLCGQTSTSNKLLSLAEFMEVVLNRVRTPTHPQILMSHWLIKWHRRWLDLKHFYFIWLYWWYVTLSPWGRLIHSVRICKRSIFHIKNSGASC